MTNDAAATEPAPSNSSASGFPGAKGAPAAGGTWAEGEPLDLRRLKDGLRRLYPPNHPVRVLIEAEPDTLPRREGAAKLETLLVLIFALREDRW